MQIVSVLSVIFVLAHQAHAFIYDHGFQYDYFKSLIVPGGKKEKLKLIMEPEDGCEDHGVFKDTLRIKWDEQGSPDTFEEDIKFLWEHGNKKNKRFEVQVEWPVTPFSGDQLFLFFYRSKMYYGKARMTYAVSRSDDGHRIVTFTPMVPPMTPGELACMNAHRDVLQHRCKTRQVSCLELVSHCKSIGVKREVIRTAINALSTEIPDDVELLQKHEGFWHTLEDRLIVEYARKINELFDNLMQVPETAMNEEEKALASRYKVLSLTGPKDLIPVDDVQALRKIALKAN